MDIDSDITLIDGKPLIYIKSISALICSDLHLGYEDMMAARGIFMPHVNLNSILNELNNAIDLLKPKLLIIDGDIKNEFSNTETYEFNELYDFFNQLKTKDIKIILIKGNHDNYVDKYKKSFNIELYNDEFIIDKYLFFHGESMPTDKYKETDILIMGHEHPSIRITSESGKIERLKCFLSGTYKGKLLLVLPAIGYFASGTPINAVRKNDLISPIFNEIDIDRMDAIVIGYDDTINFGKIKDLREI